MGGTMNLGDEFDNNTGEFEGYDADTPDEQEVATQKHVDMRSIIAESGAVYISMLHLTAMFDMATLNDRTMQQLRGTLDITTGERWSKGSISKDPSRNNWSVLTVQCNEDEETIFHSILRR
jgi:hypothetical protein